MVCLGQIRSSKVIGGGGGGGGAPHHLHLLFCKCVAFLFEKYVSVDRFVLTF